MRMLVEGWAKDGRSLFLIEAETGMGPSPEVRLGFGSCVSRLINEIVGDLFPESRANSATRSDVWDLPGELVVSYQPRSYYCFGIDHPSRDYLAF